jgi:hypothetical protein
MPDGWTPKKPGCEHHIGDVHKHTPTITSAIRGTSRHFCIVLSPHADEICSISGLFYWHDMHGTAIALNCNQDGTKKPGVTTTYKRFLTAHLFRRMSTRIRLVILHHREMVDGSRCRVNQWITCGCLLMKCGYQSIDYSQTQLLRSSKEYNKRT